MAHVTKRIIKIFCVTAPVNIFIRPRFARLLFSRHTLTLIYYIVARKKNHRNEYFCQLFSALQILEFRNYFANRGWIN